MAEVCQNVCDLWALGYIFQFAKFNIFCAPIRPLGDVCAQILQHLRVSKLKAEVNVQTVLFQREKYIFSQFVY